ncbi:phage recombination protein Bet [Caproiciproducens galactitolivorans]|jgi:phage recombination protein Bet|uniref:RecT family protein n=1 Tax=Caproiciproducens galactitolivorans TaxID=642589 RepID=A0A4Z0Y8P8_9FIRM|nr:phage recombination protein Bet [Caproiciproducens galactitolivorans]QEY33856.1 phage recombination protein Bet [Caproiciproducens galactitolivorans]QEY34642.1 phage recombination protein Bet [Caproiciproducens galactitolivorans]TGJ75330.1 RecT family protein [Caproiciproducens galactitolivorans]
MVQNKLAAQQENKVVEYEVNGEKVKLSPAIIRNYLVSGGGNVSDQEIVMFLNLCRFQHLNPFLREAYLIKYGNQPATMVTGKEVFTKRARRNKDYAGQQAGVVVQKEDGTLENRIGTLVLDDEKLVGGWAKVFIKDYVEPVEITVSLSEYIGTKKDGEINSQWSKKPATMIRKVALVQALREAFPEDFSGMYSQEEIDTGNQILDETPIDESKVVDVPPQEQKPEETDPLA